MSRGEYLIRRLGWGVLVILGVLVVTFIVSRVVPGDPARLYAGHRADSERIEEARETLGLNDPLPKQFILYVSSILRGDFGYSVRTKRPILEDIKIRLPSTMELVITSMVVTFIIGIPLGVLSAAKPGGLVDRMSLIVTVAGVSTPRFWLALLLQLLFFIYLGWMPLSGRISQEVMLNNPIETITGFHLVDAAITANWVAWKDALWHMIMPVVVLSTYPVCVVVRMTRASMADVLSKTYITAARAAGLPEREILFKWALKNGIVPTLTVMGMMFAYSITGSVLVEIVFNWPGMGTYMTNAILSSDIFVLFAVTIVVTIIYVFINLLLDFFQAFLDPRIRLGETGEV